MLPAPSTAPAKSRVPAFLQPSCPLFLQFHISSDPVWNSYNYLSTAGTKTEGCCNLGSTGKGCLFPLEQPPRMWSSPCLTEILQTSFWCSLITAGLVLSLWSTVQRDQPTATEFLSFCCLSTTKSSKDKLEITGGKKKDCSIWFSHILLFL